MCIYTREREVWVLSSGSASMTVENAGGARARVDARFVSARAHIAACVLGMTFFIISGVCWGKCLAERSFVYIGRFGSSNVVKRGAV